MNRRGFFGRMLAGAAAVVAVPAVKALANTLPTPEPEAPAVSAPEPPAPTVTGSTIARGYLPSYIGVASDEQFYDSDYNWRTLSYRLPPLVSTATFLEMQSTTATFLEMQSTSAELNHVRVLLSRGYSTQSSTEADSTRW